MAQRTEPPFRADMVGSLLRPAELMAARERFKAGALSALELREIEDKAIREVVREEEAVGLRAVTDGEFRRTFFHLDFLEKLGGIEIRGGTATKFHTQEGEIELAPQVVYVTGKLRHVKPIQLADFLYLKSVATRLPKVSVPSPTMLHFRGGRDAISREAYPDLEEFYDDVAAVYRAELKSLGDAGCRYVQFDDTNLAFLCDPEQRAQAKARGEDLDALPHRYAKLINEAIAGRPAGMKVCIHLCRGNFKGSWVAEGGYEPIARTLFGELKVDGYFLEYDDARSGDFAPLRHAPKDKIIVLGLVTTKLGKIETKDELKRRIEEAAKVVPLENLCLSPQCGFASAAHGGAMDYDAQWAKLRTIVEIAREVWGA